MKENDQHGTFPNPAEVRLVRTLPGPIERVWDFIVDPEKRARWFAGGPMEPRKGGKVLFTFHNKNLAPGETPPEEYKRSHEPGFEMEGRVTRWEPPRVLGFTFGSTGDSDVTFELSPRGTNVLLVLTHRTRGEDIPDITLFASGWHTHVAHLVALLEGSPRPAFYPPMLRARAEYERLLEAAKAR